MFCKFAPHWCANSPNIHRSIRSTSTRQVSVFAAGCILLLSAHPGLWAQTVQPSDTITVPETLIDTAQTNQLSQDTAGVREEETIGEDDDVAGKDTVRYESATIEYDMERKQLHLTGNAVVRYQDITLYADSITYLIDDNIFIASGSPQLVEGGDTTVGEYMTYNINTRRGSLRYASTHMDEAYFNSRHVVKAKDNTFHAHDGDYTTCAYPDHPHYYFYAKDIKFVPNDKIYARPAVFNIGGVPVGALPYIILPVDRRRNSGILTPRFGGNPGSDFYLDNLGYYWAPNDYMDLTVAGKVQEFREYVLRASSGYRLRYWLNGNISARYSLDTDYRNPTNEWALDYAHNQMLTPDGTFTLSGRGNLVSATDFYSDFSEDTTELLSRKLNANLSLSKRFPSINASASLDWNRDHNLKDNIITENIPNIRFSLPSRPLIPLKQPSLIETGTTTEIEPKWYNKIYYSWNGHGVQRHVVSPDALLREDRDYYRRGVEQNFSASYTQKVLKYFDFTPSFNLHAFAIDAYRDTLPSDTLIVADTLRDTLTFAAIADTHTVIDTFVQTDELGYTDTVYEVITNIELDSTPVFKPVLDWTGDHTWSAGAGLGTRIYGIFPIRFLNFTGLRHTLTPNVSYSFAPRNDIERNRNYDNIGIRTTSESPMSQSFRFSAGNTFEGKRIVGTAREGEKPQERSFTMLTANMGISYGYNAQDSIRPWSWSDLGLSASIPNKFFNVSFNSAFWVYDADQNLSPPILRNYSVSLAPRFNIGATGGLWGGDKMVLAGVAPVSQDPVEYGNAGMQQFQFSLRPSYSFSQSRNSPLEDFTTTKRYNLSASASMNFTRKWYVSWGSYYDFLSNKFVGHNLSFRGDLECWDLRFNWSPSGINPGFHFLIQIKKIPEIKWELRD